MVLIVALGVLLDRASVPNPTIRSDRPSAYLADKSIKVQVTQRQSPGRDVRVRRPIQRVTQSPGSPAGLGSSRPSPTSSPTASCHEHRKRRQPTNPAAGRLP